MRKKETLRKFILHIDGIAAFLVGAALLIFLPYVTKIYSADRGIIEFIGASNLVFSAYSLWLAFFATRTVPKINFLVIANTCWCINCIVMLVNLYASSSPLLRAHISLEGAFVASLAFFEYKNRNYLAQIKTAN